MYTGSCHCGAIGLRYHTQQLPESWSVRACQCRFCRLHRVVTTSDPQARIEFSATVAALLNKYRFARHTADYLLCGRCGVYIGAVIETARGRFGVININTLDPIPLDVAAPVAMEYGTESHEQRVARRELRWSPVGSLACERDV